eukprot:3284588-Amphidinium_carterae.2
MRDVTPPRRLRRRVASGEAVRLLGPHLGCVLWFNQLSISLTGMRSQRVACHSEVALEGMPRIATGQVVFEGGLPQWRAAA